MAVRAASRSSRAAQRSASSTCRVPGLARRRTTGFDCAAASSRWAAWSRRGPCSRSAPGFSGVEDPGAKPQPQHEVDERGRRARDHGLGPRGHRFREVQRTNVSGKRDIQHTPDSTGSASGVVSVDHDAPFRSGPGELSVPGRQRVRVIWQKQRNGGGDELSRHQAGAAPSPVGP